MKTSFNSLISVLATLALMALATVFGNAYIDGTPVINASALPNVPQFTRNEWMLLAGGLFVLWFFVDTMIRRRKGNNF